ncbi:FK506-binding protein 1B [Xylaria cf. heliscus]|nr:FK506-binding protein 1B [Xylaria cf. heliscus]
MGVTKTVLQEGTGAQPAPGQTVTIEYTGWLKDTTKPDNKGDQFDSSVGRGDFVTRIGVGQVIKGWDEGVTQMKVGEKATLDISRQVPLSEIRLGASETNVAILQLLRLCGFTGHIPPNADLIFDVYLKKVQ